MTTCPICHSEPGTLEPIAGEEPWTRCDKEPRHVTRPFTAKELEMLDRVPVGISWGSPDWGKPGRNVHESSDGSWVFDRHDVDTHTGKVKES